MPRRVVPKSKYILNGRYSQDAWSLELTGTYYDSYTYNVGDVPGVATVNGNIDSGVLAGDVRRSGLRLRAAAGPAASNLLVQNVGSTSTRKSYVVTATARAASIRTHSSRPMARVRTPSSRAVRDLHATRLEMKRACNLH